MSKLLSEAGHDRSLLGCAVSKPHANMMNVSVYERRTPLATACQLHRPAFGPG